MVNEEVHEILKRTESFMSIIKLYAMSWIDELDLAPKWARPDLVARVATYISSIPIPVPWFYSFLCGSAKLLIIPTCRRRS